jgi:hypothetical protein
MLSKKHYKEIAEIFVHNSITPESTVYKDFVQMFKSDNPRFDESRFKEAIR